jgi:redox-sensitive bicupin YhaK (pirin superfamily)
MNFNWCKFNDDTVSQGCMVLQHPHDNMEIISIPLEGDLEHHKTVWEIMTVT